MSPNGISGDVLVAVVQQLRLGVMGAHPPEGITLVSRLFQPDLRRPASVLEH